MRPQERLFRQELVLDGLGEAEPRRFQPLGTHLFLRRDGLKVDFGQTETVQEYLGLTLDNLQIRLGCLFPILELDQ